MPGLLPRPSLKLLGYLDLAHKYVGDLYLTRGYQGILLKIATAEELLAVEQDDRHPLWWFLPPILYDLFGAIDDLNWINQERHVGESIVMVPPPFTSVAEQLDAELAAMGLVVARERRLFSRSFVTLLYGGYPWFESYMRICETHKLPGQLCTVFRVTSDSLDVAQTLLAFKKRRRDSFGASLRIGFANREYPGLIRPFHTPARIENRRHIRAIDVG